MDYAYLQQRNRRRSSKVLTCLGEGLQERGITMTKYLPKGYDSDLSDEEWDERFLRGCKEIPRSTDQKPHFLTKSGKEVVVDTTVKFELCFGGIGLCPYNAKWLSHPWPDTGLYESYAIDAGTWGFIDTEGNVVIEPQYVYALGPFGYYCKEEYFVVAKMVDGKARWGVLDHTGTEAIPCQYTAIHDTEYDVVIFQEEEKGLYGLMYIDGTIIIKPKFAHIDSFEVDMHNKILVAGTDNYFVGVYSLEKDQFIVPCRFGVIWLLSDYIEADYCELTEYEEKDEDFDYEEFNNLVKQNNIEFGGLEYFDYEGNLLDKMEVYRREYHKQIGISE